MLNGRNPFAVEVGTMPPNVKRTDAAAALPAPVLVPDVTTQGTQPVNYDEFVGAVEASERSAAAEAEEES
ncbi:hypothetical protein D3C81_1698290 [compost metagenome]